MIFGTLGRYFASRFIGAALAVFGGVFTLVVLVDYVEMTRQASGLVNAPALLVAKVSLFRVPQVMERIVPFAILIGTMVCYFTLSRRHELVIARSAGMSAWQFVRPAVVIALLTGVLAAVVYNPLAASLREQSKRMEAELFGDDQARKVESFWLRQRSQDGQSIINASESRNQGASLDGVTAFAFDSAGHFMERIHARRAELKSGYWELTGARVYRIGVPPSDHAAYQLSTNLTTAQVRESFATPETVSFWQLPKYIEAAEQAGLMAAAYRLQYQVLLAKPFLLAAMVMLAAAVSLRFFRFGGIMSRILSGIVAGFLLYVIAKVTEDVSRAELIHPMAGAWLPVLVGGLTGYVAMLYQEDG